MSLSLIHTHSVDVGNDFSDSVVGGISLRQRFGDNLKVIHFKLRNLFLFHAGVYPHLFVHVLTFARDTG